MVVFHRKLWVNCWMTGGYWVHTARLAPELMLSRRAFCPWTWHDLSGSSKDIQGDKLKAKSLGYIYIYWYANPSRNLTILDLCFPTCHAVLDFLGPNCWGDPPASYNTGWGQGSRVVKSHPSAQSHRYASGACAVFHCCWWGHGNCRRTVSCRMLREQWHHHAGSSWDSG